MFDGFNWRGGCPGNRRDASGRRRLVRTAGTADRLVVANRSKLKAPGRSEAPNSVVRTFRVRPGWKVIDLIQSIGHS